MSETDILFNDENLPDIDFDKYLPENAFFGFSAGLDKQNKNDVITSINNYVKDNFSTKRNAFFKITKVVNHTVLPDGYFYEIHEKGFGISFSEKILFHFGNEDNSSALLRINGKNVFIIRRLDTIETNYTSSEYITEKQRQKSIKINQEKFILSIKKPDMERVFKDKFAFFIISSIVLISSLIAFISIYTNNAIHLSIKEPVKTSPVKIEIPVYEINSIQSSYTERLVSITLKNNNFIARNERLIDEETMSVEQFERPLRVDNTVMRQILRNERERELERERESAIEALEIQINDPDANESSDRMMDAEEGRRELLERRRLLEEQRMQERLERLERVRQEREQN